MKVTGIIVSRMDSRRLPGKVLEPLGGLPLVEVTYERARRARRLDEVVLATSDRTVDDPLAAWAANREIAVFRGAADDVAGRLLAAATHREADYAFRLNGDSPFVDPALLDEAAALLDDGRPDLVSNLGKRHFPYGVAVELFRVGALEEARALMTTPELREHATQAFYRHPERFDIRWMEIPDNAWKTARLVVDTEADYRLMTAVAEALGDELLTADWRRVAQTWMDETSPTTDHEPS